MDHTLWHIIADNDQVQCNIDPASVSGSTTVGSGSVNSNAGVIMRTIPIVAEMDGVFEIVFDKPKIDAPVEMVTEKLRLKKGEAGKIPIEIRLKQDVKDGVKGLLTARLLHNEKQIGGVTFQIETATAYAQAYVFTERGMKVPKFKVILRHPGDPRRIVSVTNRNGVAIFGPLNPGFYWATIEENDQPPVRVFIKPGKENPINFFIKDLLPKT